MKLIGLLPIGSVIRLKEGKINLMVIGYAQRKLSDPDSFFDYAACPHPQGAMSAEQTILFNQDSIETICSIGYMNDESLQFMNEAEAEMRKYRERKSEAGNEEKD